MKHLNRDQLLDWVENGQADDASRAHLKTCEVCARQLSSLREVFQILTASDTTPDLEVVKAEQFREDLHRKIRLLPEPSPLRAGWDFMRRVVSFPHAAVAMVSAAVIVFSIITIFRPRYDKMPLVESPSAMTQEAPAGNSSDNLADSMAVAETLAASQNLQASDLFEAAVNSENAVEEETGTTSEFSGDPFQGIAGLKPEEVAQLKALIKEQLKG